MPLAVNLKLGRHFRHFIGTEYVAEGLQVKRQCSAGLPEGCAGLGINTSHLPVDTPVVLLTLIVLNPFPSLSLYRPFGLY